MIWCQLNLGGRADTEHGNMPPQMVSLTNDYSQHNATVITPLWPSVS